MDDFRVNLVKNPGMMETKMAMESGVPTSMPEAVPVQPVANPPVANPPGTVMQCAYCDGDIEGSGISVSGSKVCSEVCADEIRGNPDKNPIKKKPYGEFPTEMAVECNGCGEPMKGIADVFTSKTESHFEFDDDLGPDDAEIEFYEMIGEDLYCEGCYDEAMDEATPNPLPEGEIECPNCEEMYDEGDMCPDCGECSSGYLPGCCECPKNNPSHKCYSCSDMVHDVCRKCDCGDCCCDCNSRMLKNVAKLGGFAAIAGGLFWFIRSESE